MPKKTLKDNNALQFINPNTNEYIHDIENTEYEFSKLKMKNDCTIEKQERKTKRLNLLLQPSMLEDLSKIAYMKQTSVNNLINSILKGYTNTETAIVAKYNGIFTEKKACKKINI